MAKESEYQALLDRIAALQETVTDQHAADLIANPQLADALMDKIDAMLEAVVAADQQAKPPPDQGLAQLAGVGPDAAAQFGVAVDHVAHGVDELDDELGHVVAGRRLAAENEGARLNLRVRVRLDAVIERDDVQDV